MNCINYNQQEDILCVHGDQRLCPTAQLNLTINDHPYLLNVGVFQKLPVALLLGWDLPVLLDLFLENQPIGTDLGVKGTSGVNISCLVVTRSMEKSGSRLLPDLGSGLSEQSTPEPDGVGPSGQLLPDFDNSKKKIQSATTF